MKVIVVTGGIASGKSTVVQVLAELCGEGVALFDCDKAVADLQRSGRLSRDLVTAFGQHALDEEGAVNKELLRNIVRHDPEGRRKLEEIIHPKLAQMCLESQAEARKRGNIHTYLIDIPLYFESSVEFNADCVCLAAVTPETQIVRMQERDGFTREEAEAMLAAQMPSSVKVDRADFVFWNECSREMLKEQIRHFYNAEIAQLAKEVTARSTVYDLNELRALPFNELQKLAATVPSKNGGMTGLTRAALIFEMSKSFLKSGNQLFASGVIEVTRDNLRMLRDPGRSLRPMEDDIYLPNDLVAKYNLRPGNFVKVHLAAELSGKAKALRADQVVEIEGVPAADFVQKKDFDKLTPLIPKERLILENAEIKSPAMRILDLITPIGLGQRALIVAPPRGGKTVLLKTIAKSIHANYPKAELLILLLDERPEEVTDFEETVDAKVYASTFDEPSSRHAQLSDLVLERARRLAESGKDVIILLDSLTRLSRGYNANQSGGRTMSGGLGSNALEKPRRFFGAARKLEEGGSLTIIATCLVETESRMDEIIFEEFKGTGNMEIRLDRELAERRIYPAISIPQSGTRNDDRLYCQDEFLRVLQVRRQLASHPGWEALEILLRNISRTQNNAELLLRGILS